MAVTFNIVKTTELTEAQRASIVNNFNVVFEKNLSAQELLRFYVSTPLGYSYHSLMEDDGNVAGYFSAVPYTYSFYKEEKIFCYIGGLFIIPAYRKDPLALYKLYAAAKKYLTAAGVALLMAVPNDNAYPYFRHALKWHEVAALNYHALPVRYGNISGKKVMNIISLPGSYFLLMLQNIFSLLLNSKEKQADIFLLPHAATAEKQRYSDGHAKIKTDAFSAFYKMENEEGIQTAYLIDFYNANGNRDSRSLYRSVKHIVNNENPDLVLFIGPLRLKQFMLFKVPQKKQPRTLHFCTELLEKELGEKAYGENAWNFGLYNFDVR